MKIADSIPSGWSPSDRARKFLTTWGPVLAPRAKGARGDQGSPGKNGTVRSALVHHGPVLSPTHVQANILSPTSLELTWTPTGETNVWYFVFTLSGRFLGSTLENTWTVRDIDVTAPGLGYQVRAVATNASSDAVLVPVTPAMKPDRWVIDATFSNQRIQVQWQPLIGSSVTEYQVKIRDENHASQGFQTVAVLAPQDGTLSYELLGLQPGLSTGSGPGWYTVAVCAVNSHEVKWSRMVRGFLSTIPSAPVVSSQVVAGFVTLTWQPVAATDAGIAGAEQVSYKVWVGNSVVQTISAFPDRPTETSATLTLSPGTYDLGVSAFYSNGESQKTLTQITVSTPLIQQLTSGVPFKPMVTVNRSLSLLTFSWLPPYSATPIEGYHLTVREADGAYREVVLPPDATSWTYDGSDLVDASIIQVSVSAFNASGGSESVSASGIVASYDLGMDGIDPSAYGHFIFVDQTGPLPRDTTVLVSEPSGFSFGVKTAEEVDDWIVNGRIPYTFYYHYEPSPPDGYVDRGGGHWFPPGGNDEWVPGAATDNNFAQGSFSIGPLARAALLTRNVTVYVTRSGIGDLD